MRTSHADCCPSALLVSVTDPHEAELALAGGADLIDVKDPSRGSLGKADDAVIAAVLGKVRGRAPVSAALGELVERSWQAAVGAMPTSLAFVKFGLAGCSERSDWRDELSHLSATSGKVVAVAYADWRQASAPHAEQVVSFAIRHRCAAFLFDTWDKRAGTLLDCLPIAKLQVYCQRLRDMQIPIALAGRLGVSEIRRLASLRPQWFAVRGSACRDGQRGHTIDKDRVTELKSAICGEKS